MSIELLNNVFEATDGDRGATREIVEAILEGNKYDISTGDYRWRAIEDEMVREVMIEEMAGDEYTLGCASPWFLSEIIGLDVEVIEALHEADKFDAIGRTIIKMGKVGEMVDGIIRYDGPGNHFASWDGSERSVDYFVQKAGEKAGKRVYWSIFKN